jgi:hypothetical protein
MGIAGAVFEGSLARASALTLEQERRDRARQLQEFEDLLDSVESQNLLTEQGVPDGVMAQIVIAARRLSVPPPAAVLKARSGARLHEALLTWQGALLDALRPHRLSFGDRFD